MLRILPSCCFVLVATFAAPVDGFADSLAGRWNLVAQSPDDDDMHEYVLVLKTGADGRLGGEIAGEIGTHALSNIRVEGSTLSFEITLARDDGEMAFAVRLEKRGTDLLVGQWQVKGSATVSGAFRSRRIH